MRNRIKDLREDNDLYQKDIAKILGVTRQQYSKFEINKNELSYDGLIKLSDFYNTSIDYILGLTDKKIPHKKLNSPFNNRIKELRLKNNLYQNDIANVLNVTQQQYSKAEIGKNKLTYDELIKLALFYNTSIDYILGLTINKIPYPKKEQDI